MKYRYQCSIALVFLWIGFVSAISFMEAWLKFQAPGISTELGLGIGQLVFKALNRVEIGLGILLGTVLGFYKNRGQRKSTLLFLWVPLLLLGLQTFWLLPELDVRASMRIQGEMVPNNRLHLWYVLMEVAKLGSLLIFGIALLRKMGLRHPKNK
ncbi:hypothetical protein [Spongiimicrobium salis]|uniref:hypothetical protein n=1 Tax=Spongiimicrobium salis TaxID=1667022 RepID=UPI00374D7288